MKILIHAQNSLIIWGYDKKIPKNPKRKIFHNYVQVKLEEQNSDILYISIKNYNHLYNVLSVKLIRKIKYRKAENHESKFRRTEKEV